MSPLRISTKITARRYGPAQPAVPADRFAREIGAILEAFPTRLRQLNGKPVGGLQPECRLGSENI
jgi:hypothetical protein